MLARTRNVAVVALALLMVWSHLDEARAQSRSQRQAFSSASLKVEPESLDFGDVRPGQVVEGSVTLTNESEQPLVLLRTATSCACAAPSFSQRKTLEPGESLVLPIAYTGFDQHIGETSQQVVVFVEGFSIPTQIAVRANINRGIRPTVEFDPPDQYLVANITLEAIDNRPFRIESVNFADPVYLDGFDPAVDEPRTRYRIRQDLSVYEPEEIPRYLLVVTDHVDSPVMNLRVMNLAYEPPREYRPFLIQQAPVLLHAVPATGVTTAEVQLLAVRGQAYDMVEWFEASSEHAVVSLLGVESTPDRAQAKLRLGIRPMPTHRGLLTIYVWVTIGGHTEMTVLHGRVFAAEELPQIEQQPEGPADHNESAH